MEQEEHTTRDSVYVRSFAFVFLVIAAATAYFSDLFLSGVGEVVGMVVAVIFLINSVIVFVCYYYSWRTENEQLGRR